jgi:sterol desaturase/sphingolipid hydroxylase (fatty acid hydroxylase superfamily)
VDAVLSALLDFGQGCYGFLEQSAVELFRFLTTTWTDPDSLLFWPYFLVFFFWAWLAFRRNYQGHGIRNFFEFVFPRKIYLHRSSATDLQIFLLNRFLLAPHRLLKGFASPALAAWVLGLNPGDPLEAFPLDPWTSLLFWAVWLAAAELGYYLQHRAFHQIPWLWEFHKVHHSAEVMTPLTLFRKHPVFEMGTGLSVAIVRGLLLVEIVLLTGGEFHAVHLFAFNIYDMMFRAAGEHLRHSHIWWAWGPRISHFFLSPAQHQVHHSYDARHIDKNFGEILAVWDWLFGTLYVAGRQREELKLGLGYEDHGLDNALAAYFVPFRNIGRKAIASLRRPAREPVQNP